MAGAGAVLMVPGAGDKNHLVRVINGAGGRELGFAD